MKGKKNQISKQQKSNYISYIFKTFIIKDFLYRTYSIREEIHIEMNNFSNHQYTEFTKLSDLYLFLIRQNDSRVRDLGLKNSNEYKLI